ncbi:MAG: hypothetical protein IT437_05880 [Phycisphaerales bacterium]|nr:hypothetical protein [Phycisphaerales bacterium]
MARCRVDETIERQAAGGFQFPLGVYPVEPMTPKPGYCVDFEPADGGDAESGEFQEEGPAANLEEWPDRYVFDVVISAEKLEPLCRSLLALLPGRVYPIFDYLGQDAYREVDPYISYDLLGMDRMLDCLRRFRGFFFEDGLCGFGAMIDEPFFYVFVDEHKIVTIRAETAYRERIERLLAAHDLAAIDTGAEGEGGEGPAGADSAAHEHRGVLVAPDDRPDLLTQDEIVEYLRDDWRLVLNIDPDANVDEEDRPLGVTPWRCLVRCLPGPDGKPEDPRYLDVLLSAPSLRRAEELAMEAADQLLPEGLDEWDEVAVITSDRLTPERWAELTHQPADPDTPTIPLEEGITSRSWLE